MKFDKTKLMPRETGKFIAQLAENVFIEKEGIQIIAKKVVENLRTNELSVNNFSESIYHPDSNDPRAADWLLVLDTLNFCFWSDINIPKWKVNGETGYFAMCAAIKRAIEEGIPITDSNFISKITRDELQKILRGDENSEVPLINERVKNLNEVGRILIEKYSGTFSECIKNCQNSAEKLLKLIIQDFECFRDEAQYKNHQVSFYKRAQILIGDIWSCFHGKDLGAFHDIQCITMFADYRVPQVLLHFGAMRYSEFLWNKLLSDNNLSPGCVEEIEIRGCSIEVVERVVEEVNFLINKYPSPDLNKSSCNSILVDYFLWDYRRSHVEELDNIPFHKVRTIFY